MIKNLINAIKKYKIVLITALIIVIIGAIGLFIFLKFFKNTPIQSFNNEYYNFEYDKSWKLEKTSENKVAFNHSKGASLNAEIIDLEDEYKYSAIDDLVDDILYDIESQNTAYRLIAREKTTVTENGYDGYKALYETDTSQAMIIITKRSDKLIVFIYEAENEVFDIILDSAQNIIYNFNISTEKFELSYKINVETAKVEYGENKEIEKLLKDVKSYDIASNNYLVNYSIPAEFEMSSFDSNWGYFNYRGGEDTDIVLSATIRNSSIYEYLDKNEEYGTIYSENSYARDNEDGSYTDYKEALEKVESDYESYIYKVNYISKGSLYDTLYDKVYKIYALDKNHTLIIKIESRGANIPQKLVDMVVINSAKNYSSYIQRQIVDGNQISVMKAFTNYDKNEIEEITLKIPEKYKEIDYNMNVYEKRYFGLNYNEDEDEYQYEIKYSIYSHSIEDGVESVNDDFSTDYGSYQYLELEGELELNGKKFTCYKGAYTSPVGVYTHEKVLFYQMDSEDYVMIEISGNGVEISNEILNELTNFDIKIEKYE